MNRPAASFALCIALLYCACGAPAAPRTDGAAATGTSWYELRFTEARLPAVRASGAPWHVEASDDISGLLFGLLGLAVGDPAIAFALGSAVTDAPSPEAPAPFVVVKIEDGTYRISPVGRTLAPRWRQAIAIPEGRHAMTASAVVQVLDAVDESLLGQIELTVAELLTPGTRTLTNVGEVASLDVSVAAQPGRAHFEDRIVVDSRHTLEALVDGADPAWRAIPVWNGDRVTIRASGKSCPRDNNDDCFGPKGVPEGLTQYNRPELPDAPHAALVGLLPGGPFVVGTGIELVAAEAGWLLLYVNDSDVGNNEGVFDVSVTVRAP